MKVNDYYSDKKEAMEIQLQELIDKIKRDGIESATAEAAKVKKDAEAEASRTIEAAKKEAADIIAKAKTDAERSEKAGDAALAQASRNAVLAFKDEIQTLLDKLIAEKTASALDEGTLKAVLPELLKNWASSAAAGKDPAFDVLVSEGDAAKLKDWFVSKVQAEVGKGVELKASRALAAGFRIASKDGAAYYDFSADAVADILSAYLNPKLGAILKTSAKEA
jgi:V/A-type H+-transporting ATPase subunit E